MGLPTTVMSLVSNVSPLSALRANASARSAETRPLWENKPAASAASDT